MGAGSPGRFGLSRFDTPEHAGVRGGHVSVVEELQLPPGEAAADPPASAARAVTGVRALDLDELNSHTQYLLKCRRGSHRAIRHEDESVSDSMAGGPHRECPQV